MNQSFLNIKRLIDEIYSTRKPIHMDLASMYLPWELNADFDNYCDKLGIRNIDVDICYGIKGYCLRCDFKY